MRQPTTYIAKGESGLVCGALLGDWAAPFPDTSAIWGAPLLGDVDTSLMIGELGDGDVGGLKSLYLMIHKVIKDQLNDQFNNLEENDSI